MDKPYIAGSIVCPLVYLDLRLEQLPKNRPMIIVDWINKRSIIAAKYLKNKGFHIEGVLKGGIMRWQEEHLPMRERPAGSLGHIENL